MYVDGGRFASVYTRTLVRQTIIDVVSVIRVDGVGQFGGVIPIIVRVWRALLR